MNFVEALKKEGFDFFTGVADSLVASLIKDLEKENLYLPAVREDLAVGLAAGAALSGRRCAILMQNSGLGYCLNALTSLNLIYKIPVLLIVGYRGYQGKDAPEHWVMGRHCEPLLKEIGIPVWAPESAELSGSLARANLWIKENETPAAILIKPGVLE